MVHLLRFAAYCTLLYFIFIVFIFIIFIIFILLCFFIFYKFFNFILSKEYSLKATPSKPLKTGLSFHTSSRHLFSFNYYTHTYLCTCIHTYLHTHAYIYTHIRTHVHTFIHTYIHVGDIDDMQPAPENLASIDEGFEDLENLIPDEQHDRFRC